ncbi:hypothetical protein N7476_000271 [Penicillium atrosanguineum]|uniref:PHD and RING finger domain protein n=1 Tax=Penicillium atrosanguineum TaxID=1132637 RepID=A0A9W9QE76_9EURO|nr:hypothetical protein N7476_000271 [Penicillium atrosanguineum]
MSDTCIVCLGDLGESAGNPLAAEPVNPDKDVSKVRLDEDSQIAQLLPCGHILHNNCLKPWVERANSCPICRRNFNMVELTDSLGGPVISSYAVQDRTQVADVDPSMVIEYAEDELADFQPCTICGEADNEDVLLLCDGCDAPSHLYCVGLDEIPAGAWYCSQCESQRAIGPATEVSARSARAERRNRRTRAEQRRAQSSNNINSLHWARVWQSVWDHLNIDLDFPFDDDRSVQRVMQQRRRDEANQREFRAWQRRFEVAERQGGGSRFRDTASLFDIEPARPSRPRVPREPTPEPESLEEMRAWNAFERAREIENNPNAARKRKEPTMSPSPEPTEPERKLKRPRTRRPQELAAIAQQHGESSRAASSTARLANGDISIGEPSFLSSLLKEVEDSSTTERATSHGPSAPTSIAPTDHATPGPSSPSISPVSSNHSSPRISSTTPPPFSRSRPISPLQLSSPAEPSSPPFSPEVSFSGSPASSPSKTSPLPAREAGRPRARIPRRAVHHFSSPDTSPTRAGPSLAVKSDIQKMVGAALKPHYRAKTISKDQFTEINRTISRKLYERVGTAESLDPEPRTDIEAVAKHEVQNTILALHKKDKQPMLTSDSDGDVQ